MSVLYFWKDFNLILLLLLKKKIHFYLLVFFLSLKNSLKKNFVFGLKRGLGEANLNQIHNLEETYSETAENLSAKWSLSFCKISISLSLSEV